MTKIDKPTAFSRRSVLKTTGMLVVSFGMPAGVETALGVNAALAQAGRPALDPRQLDSYLAIKADGSVAAFFGKTDGGQGVDVAIAQIVAEELDVAVARVEVVMGDSATSVNQGGASNASAIEEGAVPLRNAAAAARRVLLDMAAERLKMPVDELIVTDGIVSAKNDALKKLSYGELIGARRFNVELEWNQKYGNSLSVKGKATPKKPAEYQIVGQTVRRRDIAAKVYGKLDYITDIKVPGMLHARMLRPPVAGAVPVSVDESSIKDIPGVRVVWKQGFLGVVADKEWDAVRAVQRLKVSWSSVQPPFPAQSDLYDHIRKAPVKKRAEAMKVGDVEPALAGAAKIVQAEYEWPFQSHSSMGPGCAVVEIKDGQATCWTGSQKPHYVGEGVAAILGLPLEKVRAIWVPAPGSYGRNDSGDTAIDAAVLAQAIGRPVRLQYMRHEGHAWDTKSPASVHRVRAGLDQDGKVVAFHFETKSFSRLDIATNEADPRDSLAGQLMRLPPKSVDSYLFPGEAVPGAVYNFSNKLMAWETIPPLLDRASPLRTSHLRDPPGPELFFACESFVDELAAATNSDPVEFRLRYLTDARDIAVLKAAAERAQWERPPSGPRGGASGEIVQGRGVAFARRNKTIVALIAEVDVDRRSGRVRPRRLVMAHDCGLIVNPGALRQCIENGLVYGTSRSLWEEVHFARDKVTSIDWATYPILDIKDAPDSIDIMLIDRKDQPSTGAGEPMVRMPGPAIANAIFDATGIRIRRGPFTPERVKAALS
jgi:CO/xanthine dehydrogenase Mo-binding subunit